MWIIIKLTQIESLSHQNKKQKWSKITKCDIYSSVRASHAYVFDIHEIGLILR